MKSYDNVKTTSRGISTSKKTRNAIIYIFYINMYYGYNNTNDARPINYENTRKNTPCNAIRDQRTATTARRLYL